MSSEIPTPFRRFLIAESPVRPPGERRARPLPCRVAVLPWTAERAWLSIIVVATFRFDPSSAVRPLPLEPAPPRELSIGPRSLNEPQSVEHTADALPDEEARHPDDFVPARPLVDLTLTGHVEMRATAARALAPRRAEIGLGADRLAFFVRSETPGEIPLRPPYTQTSRGAPIDVRPQPCHDGSVHHYRHPEEMELAVYQAAIPELRYEVEAVTGIHIAGVWPDPELALEIELPQLEPRALVDYAQPQVRRGDVRFYLDGVAVDVDSSTVDISWRGIVETTPEPHLDVDRIILGWAPASRWQSDAEHAWDDCLRELPRGLFHWAVERDDVKKGEDPPDLTEEELAMARYRTWGHPNAAEPEMPPEEAAVIAAELAERRWPRAHVLASRGVDEYSWGIEERAWAQRLASVKEHPSGGPSADFADAFRRTIDALGTPQEAELTPARYVALVADMAAGDPERALAEAGLTRGAFGRIERRFRGRAAEDKAFAAELERLRAEEQIRRDGPSLNARGEGKPAASSAPNPGPAALNPSPNARGEGKPAASSAPNPGASAAEPAAGAQEDKPA
jgi:hypothetical protein